MVENNISNEEDLENEAEDKMAYKKRKKSSSKRRKVTADAIRKKKFSRGRKK